MLKCTQWIISMLMFQSATFSLTDHLFSSFLGTWATTFSSLTRQMCLRKWHWSLITSLLHINLSFHLALIPLYQCSRFAAAKLTKGKRARVLSTGHRAIGPSPQRLHRHWPPSLIFTRFFSHSTLSSKSNGTVL